MTHTTDRPVPPDDGPVDPKRWRALAVCLVAGFMTLLDVSIVNVGLPQMQAGLHALQGLPINDWKNYDARIDAVGVNDLAEFARRYFQRTLRTQLVVRP